MFAAPARLAWLDALRGPAALAVTMHHAGWTFVPGLWAEVDRRIDLGTWGVFVFFLVSGYIIPASLERRGDLRAFWTGRAFRLLPSCSPPAAWRSCSPWPACCLFTPGSASARRPWSCSAT